MNVVFHATNVLGFDPVGSADPAKVTPNLILDAGGDPRLAILGGEDDVEVEGRIGMGHGERGRRFRKLFRCRSATQLSTAAYRGLKPTATVLDRYAVGKASLERTFKRPDDTRNRCHDR
jgi:hypothetical protein